MNLIILIISKMGDLVTNYSLNHVTDDKDFTSFEPQTPQYKALKNDMITSLTLKITDQASNIITDGPQVTAVLHIRDCKI